LKRADEPRDRATAARMALTLRAMYGLPRQNTAIRLAAAHYLARMRRVRRALWRHRLPELA
jgi:hypothetical protein